ncbi:NUDIX hydrolase [Saccharicrinis aurantiacus]|uniref:NUDIX hydrolase n=1 Tax=Saccharicrinis aurantiacus TaxID=1849719 RepID=UPI0024935C8B|nr:NUDIX domain-containing protein [Saccharicrinis aurantiacus]
MKEIDKIALIEIKNRQILHVRSKGKLKFYLPGGKREASETDEQTLTRELHEELSININTNTIKYLGTFKAPADGKADGVLVKITCYTAEYTGNLKPANEIEELRWLNNSNLDIISEASKKIFEFLKQKGEID